MTEYTYTISSDFPNGEMNSDMLTSEIRASAIAIALDRIETAGDVCSIWFKAALSSGDEAILDAVVFAHTDGASNTTGYTHDGAQVVRNLPYGVGRDPFRPGYRFTVTPLALNIWDILIDPATMVGTDGKVQVMGGTLWAPLGAVDDDYVEVVVVDKTGVIPDTVDGQHPSLMEHYGLPVDGSTYLEVSDKFVRQGNVPVGNPEGRSFNPGGNFELPGGVYIRFIYNATAASYTGPVKLDLNLAK